MQGHRYKNFKPHFARESGHSIVEIVMAVSVTMVIVMGLTGFLSEQSRSDKNMTKEIQAARAYDVVMHKADCCQTLAHLQPVVGKSCSQLNGSSEGLIIKSATGSLITGTDFKLTDNVQAKFYCVENGGLTKRLQLQINSKDVNGNWKSSFTDASNDTPYCVRELLDSTACSGVYAGGGTWIAGSVTEGAPQTYTPGTTTTTTSGGIAPVGTEAIDPSLDPYLSPPSGQVAPPDCGSPITVVCGMSGQMGLCNLCDTIN